MNLKNIPPSLKLFFGQIKSWILLSRNLQTLLIFLTLFLAGVWLSALAPSKLPPNTQELLWIFHFFLFNLTWNSQEMFFNSVFNPPLPKESYNLTPSEVGLRGGFMMRIVGCTLYENVMMLYQTESCATVTSGMCPILGMTEFYWHFASCKNPLLSSCRIYSKVQCVENAV